jgi:class III poly(R)-hydroxyalkanoic acid synthase PhaE subunit
MSDTSRKKSDPLAMLDLWMKTSHSFWETFSAGSAGKEREKDKKEAKPRENIHSRMPSWETAFKSWQAMAAAMAKPETLEALNKGSEALPDAFMKIMESGWNSLFTLQQMWMEKSAKIGKTAEAYSFENLDEDAFRLWNELYETEFKKYLNIPQLGLTRFYQERLQQATDKFAVFQSAMAEFINTILLPMERSLVVMQEQLAAMAEEDKLPEDTKEYYRMWVKVLEGHFMVLFKSEEYAEILHKTINSATDFSRARKEVLNDLLQDLPVPTEKDMDDLYQEIYELKKRLKALEKACSQ